MENVSHQGQNCLRQRNLTKGMEDKRMDLFKDFKADRRPIQGKKNDNMRPMHVPEEGE